MVFISNVWCTDFEQKSAIAFCAFGFGTFQCISLANCSNMWHLLGAIWPILAQFSLIPRHEFVDSSKCCRWGTRPTITNAVNGNGNEQTLEVGVRIDRQDKKTVFIDNSKCSDIAWQRWRIVSFGSINKLYMCGVCVRTCPPVCRQYSNTFFRFEF